MLDRCTAFVIASSDAQTRSLERIAHRLGIESVRPIQSRRAFESDEGVRPVAFFLFDRRLDERLMRSVMAAIRACDIDRVRYAPAMLFVDDCPFEAYLHFVHMGFDDALALPDKRDVLVQRLESQLLAPQLYIRTPTYFGPDRRRFDLAGETDERRGSGDHWHERVTFLRDLDFGIKVLKTQHVFERDGRRPEA